MFMYLDYPGRRLLEEVEESDQVPTRINRVGFLLMESFRQVEGLSRFLLESRIPLCYSFSFKSLTYCPLVDVWSGSQLAGSSDF